MENNGDFDGLWLVLRGKRLAAMLQSKRFVIVDHGQSGELRWLPSVIAESDSLHGILVMMGAMGLKADSERGMVDCGWHATEIVGSDRTWVSSKAIALRETVGKDSLGEGNLGENDGKQRNSVS